MTCVNVACGAHSGAGGRIQLSMMLEDSETSVNKAQPDERHLHRQDKLRKHDKRIPEPGCHFPNEVKTRSSQRLAFLATTSSQAASDCRVGRARCLLASGPAHARPCSHCVWQCGQLDLAADWNHLYRQAAWKRLAQVRHAIRGSCPLAGWMML